MLKSAESFFCRRKLERLRMRRKVMEQWSENGFKNFFEMGLGSANGN